MTGYPWSPGDQLKANDLNAAIAMYTPPPGTGGFVPLSGIYPMTGPLILSGDPTGGSSVNQAATKHYVDAAISSGGTFIDAPSDSFGYGRLNGAWARVLPLAGGTLTGPLILSGNPTNPLGAATMQWVTASLPPASSVLPIMDGTAAIGVGTAWARSDHVHPTDTSRYAASNPAGYQTAAQVTTSLSSYLPLAGGVVAGPTTFNAPVNLTAVTTWNGTPLFSANTATTNGTQTVFGYNAGKNLATAAIEVTIIGDSAGGSGANTGTGGPMTGTENTLVGWHSGTEMTTGYFNTALGVNTMGFETTGNGNVAIGTDAMRNSTGNANSVAVGINALQNGTAATGNVAVGSGALFGQASSSGANNVVVGYGAMNSTAWTTAGSNVVVGASPAAALTSGNTNVMIGYHAGIALTTGSNNTAIGGNSMTALTTGANNTAVGLNAIGTTNGNNNTAVGLSAGNGTTGSSNTVIGSGAMSTAGANSNNTIVGYQAGLKLASGSTNTIIGTQVGSTTLATGNNNILIGASSAIDVSAAGASNEFHLGNNATNLMRATGINTAAPAFFLDWLPTSTTYANDAAAATGGIGIGQLYRNGSAVMCRIT